MHSFEHQEAWEMKPRKLSISEVEQPEKVIHEFFEFAHLPQVRWYLWESFKAMINGNFGRLNSQERQKIVFFYEQVEKLIEGAHVLHQKSRAAS